MSRKLKHPTLYLSAKDFDTPDFFRVFNTALQLPKRELPKTIIVRDNDFFMGGYTLLFDQTDNPEKLFQLCKKRKWKELMKVTGDYWLICVDLSTKEVFVITDPVSKFSTFFTVSGKHLSLSTSFSEVLAKVSSPKLDLDACFNFVTNTRFLAMDENTPVKQIKTLPPGALLKIAPDFTWTINSLVDLNDFFSASPEPYSNTDKFIEDFLSHLSKYTKERLNVVKKFNLASDISSGFDSSLVSYVLSNIAPGEFTSYCWKSSAIDRRDTNPKIVKRFAKKHGVDLRFFNVDNMYSFSDFDLSWTAKNLYPGNHAAKVAYDYNKTVSQGKVTALFQGHGGDEIYSGPLIERELRFIIQSSYFLLRESLKMGKADKLLFTQRGIRFLFDEKRFINHGYFPPMASVSTSYLYPALFSLFWESNVWPITPFTDPRLVLFARNMPVSKDDPGLSKRRLWRNRKDIFLEEQFIPGWHMHSLFNLFVVEKKNIIIAILEKSVLSRLGYFRGKEIAKDLKAGRKESYLREGINGLLDNFLHLEHFLQKNNISN